MGWGRGGEGENEGEGTVWKGMREVDCGEKEFGEGNASSWRACRKFLIGRHRYLYPMSYRTPAQEDELKTEN